jgi:hypothetical protein
VSCERGAVPLTSVSVAALVDAVPHMPRRYEDIERAVWAADGGRGICTVAREGVDPEAWQPFPSRDADPFSEGRRRERMVAARLCGPCPVRSQCLVWSFADEAGRCGAEGVLGGLSETDRRDLRPVYRQVRAELVARAAAAKVSAVADEAAGEVVDGGAERGAGPGAGEPAAAVQAVA